MSNSDKYINNLNSDAFLRASNANTRLSLLGRELSNNIDDLVLNGKTLGQIFKNLNSKKKTIYCSDKYTLDLNNLLSNDFSCDSILLEQKQKTILFKGEEDESKLKAIKEETKKGETNKNKKDPIISFDNISNEIDNQINKKNKKGEKTMFEEIFEDNKNLNSNNVENENEGETKNEENFARPSKLINDIFDFNKITQGNKGEINQNYNIIQKNKNDNNNEITNLFNISFDNEKELDKKKEEIICEKIKENEKDKKIIIEKEEEKEKDQKDILKVEYYPIDIIEEAEKFYNLSNESKEDLKEDLYPLTTYKMKNDLSIEFIKYKEIKIKSEIIDSITTIGIDEKKNIYLCTRNGKIIKKDEKDEIILCDEKYDRSITCIDISENNVVTGDENGNIVIWINNEMNQILTDLNDKKKILFVKIIEVKNSKIIFTFSDVLGSLYLIVAKKNKIGDYSKTQIIQYKDMPIYNIIILPNNKSGIEKGKDNVFIILASSQIFGLYNLNIKEGKIEKKIQKDYFYGQKGQYQFDISVGYGFPPESDLESDTIKVANSDSISDYIVIEKEEKKNYIMAVSYGNVIQLFDVNKNDYIGYFINEKPILRLMFVFNSILALITENFNIKLVNTYDFIPKEYNPQVDNKPTKKCLISYELFDISKFGISGQEFEVNINNNLLKKYCYTNKIIAKKNGIVFIGKDLNKYYECFLLNYYDAIFNLCEKEDYIKMLWLSSIIFNKKSNILNRQLNTFEDKITKSSFKNCLMQFFLKKVMTELAKNNEIYIRMLLEYCIETDFFNILLFECIQLLISSGLDKYIYINLTKYIINGNLNEHVLDENLLNQYIKYYCQNNGKLLLNKVLLKLNLNTLLQDQIFKTISNNELINPYIITKIKKNKETIDYFSPVVYLDSAFKKVSQESIKDKYEIEKQELEKIKNQSPPELQTKFDEKIKAKEEEMEKELNEKKEIEKDYSKLIIEHNMDYFNEKTFTCHGYLGHKFLWYCNKCLLGKEYPNDNQITSEYYTDTAIKILAFLLVKENIKIYLEFDSYTYLKLISKFFIEKKLFKLIFSEGNCNNNQMFSASVKETIDKYLGKRRSESFNGDYIYRAISKVIEDNSNDLSDKSKKDIYFYSKYDFYLMTCEICSKNNNFYFDKKNIMKILEFFAKFQLDFFDEKEDRFNCHRKLKTKKEIENYYKKNEQNILTLLKYLKTHNRLEVNDEIDDDINDDNENNDKDKDKKENDDVQKLLKIKEIKQYKSVYFFLCELARKYKICFKMKIDEYERNPDHFNEDKKKKLFKWIQNIFEDTYKSDIFNEKCYNIKKNSHQKVKKILLSHLIILCEISLEELSKITDFWFFENEQEDLIHHLGGGASNALQLKYIDQHLSLNKKEMNDNIDKYMSFLEMEMDLLIKDRNRKRIKELLAEYKILCNDSLLHLLLSNRINDCSIYICQVQGKIGKGVDLALLEIQEKFENILQVLEKPNYNPILVDIELNEMYNYFEMGLNVCQNNFFDQEKENEKIDENWLKLFDKACEFKMRFYPKYEENKNNIKTKDHKKIFLTLQNCIQLILEKMSDYITLELLVEMIAKKIGEGRHGKIIEFYTFLDKSLYAFRRNETILKSCKNLMATTILIHYKDLGLLKTKGKSTCRNICNYCRCPIKDETVSFTMFECGHKYHKKCCSQEQNEKICYVCKKQEVGKDIDQIDLKIGKNVIEENDNEIKEKELSKKEDERKKRFLRKARLNDLKKLRKKRREINDVISGRVVYCMN